MANNHRTLIFLNDPIKWIAGVFSVRMALALAGVGSATYATVRTSAALPLNGTPAGQIHILLLAGVPAVLGFAAWVMLDHGAVEPYVPQLAGYLIRLLFANRPARLRRTPAPVTVSDAGMAAPANGVGERVWIEVGAGALLATLDAPARDRFSETVAALATIPAGYAAQFCVLSTPLPAAAALAPTFAALAPPTPPLAALAAKLGDWWTTHLGDRYVPVRRYLIVVTAPVPSRLSGAQAALGASLPAVSDTIMQCLDALGVPAARLDGAAVRALHAAYRDADDGAVNVTREEPEAVLGQRPTGKGTETTPWRARTFYVLTPPTTTSPGLLAPLLAFPAPLRIALHVTGLPQDKERKLAERRARQIADVLVARGGRAGVDAVDARDEALAQARRMRTGGGGAAVLRVGLYVTVFAPDDATLARRAAALWAVLTTDGAGGIGARCAHARGHQGPLEVATRPFGMDPAGSAYRMEAATVGNAWPFLAFEPGHAGGVPLGTGADGALVRLDLTDRSLKNKLVSTFGGSGQGQSYFVQTLMLWFLLRDAFVTAIDTVGGYEALATVADGAHITLGGARSAALNIWAGPRDTPEDLAARVRFVVNAHQILLSEAGRPLSGALRSAIGQGVRAVYQGHRAQSGPDRGRAVVDEPLERDLVSWLEEQGVRRNDPDERTLYRNLASELYPYVRDGEHAGIVERPTSFADDRHMLSVQIDRRDLGTDTPIYAFVLFALTALVDRRHATAKDAYARAGRGVVQHFLAWDEGWALLKHAAGQEWVSGTGLTGRHDAMCVDFVSQKISHLARGAAADYFDQASVQFIFNMHDTNDESGVDPRQWVAGKLQLTPAEAGALLTLRGQERVSAQMMMLRTTKYARTARGIVNVPATLPEVFWLFASDPDDKEARRTMVRAIATSRGGDPDRPTAADLWTAVQALVAGQTPESYRPTPAKEAHLWIAQPA